jgi:hypothetical protein
MTHISAYLAKLHDNAAKLAKLTLTGNKKLIETIIVARGLVAAHGSM